MFSRFSELRNSFYLRPAEERGRTVGMAYRLKSRQKFIPNGFRFVQPETGFQSTPNASFYSITQSLIAHRRGRPDLVAKHGWALDEASVGAEVEQFNVRLCLQHNWLNYLDGMDAGGGLPPKSKPPSPQEVAQVSVAAGKAAKIWSGIRTLNDWIDSGEPPVASELSDRRAAVCAVCPKNTQGDFTSWFTKPAAGAIQQQIGKLADRKLTTSSDGAINVCDVCLCPLKLKVHTPITFIKTYMNEDVLKDLLAVPNCWIVSEIKL